MNEKINTLLPKPKGKVKIELFEDGKKVKEHEDTNFVAFGVSQVLKLFATDYLYDDRINGKPSFSSAINSVFTRMVLSTASHEELPETEWHFRGNVVGYANVTSSSSSAVDVLQGTYNVLESFQTPQRVRTVVNFDSSKGNGTFNSIYFGSANTIYSPSSLFAPHGTALYTGDNIKMVKILNGLHYVLRTTGEFSIYNDNYERLSTFNYPNSTTMTDFEIVGDYVYFVNRSSTVPIRRASLSNLEQTEDLTQTSGFQDFGICFNTNDNNIYIVRLTEILVFNQDFNLVRTIPLPINAPSNYSAMTFLERTNEIIYNTLVYDIDNNEFTTWTEALTDTLSTSQRNICSGLLNQDTILAFQNAAPLPLLSIGSRSLLDAPITKTSNQTMKITYDFIIE